MEGTALWAPAGTSSDHLLHKDVLDGRLVFDRDTGETRLLSPLSQFIVELLEAHAQPVSTADLVRAVHAEEPEASTQECLAEVEAALGALCEARMLRQVSR